MANIKRGWGASMTPAGTGAYRGGASRVTRAGGYRKRKGSAGDADMNRSIKKLDKASKPPKGLTFRHRGVGSDARTRVGGGAPGSFVTGGVARARGR